MSFVFLKNLLSGSSPQRAKHEPFNALSHTLHANGILYPFLCMPASLDTYQVYLHSQPRTWRRTDTLPLLDLEQDLTDDSSVSTAAEEPSGPDVYLFYKAEGDFDESGPVRRRTLDPRIISDATIGLSDGLTVPFALSAGLSALGSTRVVIYGGIAELIAGAISMGMGGYLGARSEA